MDRATVHTLLVKTFFPASKTLFPPAEPVQLGRSHRDVFENIFVSVVGGLDTKPLSVGIGRTRKMSACGEERWNLSVHRLSRVKHSSLVSRFG